MNTRLKILLFSILGAIAGSFMVGLQTPDTGPEVPAAPTVTIPEFIPPPPPPKPMPLLRPPPVQPPPPPPPPIEEPIDFEEDLVEEVILDELYSADLGGIARAVKHIDAYIQACFQTHRELDPTLTPGRVLVAFTLSPLEDNRRLGEITDVVLDESSEQNIMFEGCLASAFEEIPFRRPPGGEPLPMRWPVYLKSR